jgi:hypothetical protein
MIGGSLVPRVRLCNHKIESGLVGGVTLSGPGSLKGTPLPQVWQVRIPECSR